MTFPEARAHLRVMIERYHHGRRVHAATVGKSRFEVWQDHVWREDLEALEALDQELKRLEILVAELEATGRSRT